MGCLRKKKKKKKKKKQLIVSASTNYTTNLRPSSCIHLLLFTRSGKGKPVIYFQGKNSKKAARVVEMQKKPGDGTAQLEYL
mmetsp:Transcript_2541/g.3725  ORF Transcript_2541/g.3725 Transcript_2541/m.3725 type:complete len:81 (-) Transcript_2541:36-278(-)